MRPWPEVGSNKNARRSRAVRTGDASVVRDRIVVHRDNGARADIQRIVQEVAVAFASVHVAGEGRASDPGSEVENADAADFGEHGVGDVHIARSEGRNGRASVGRPALIELDLGEGDVIDRTGAFVADRLPDFVTRTVKGHALQRQINAAVHQPPRPCVTGRASILGGVEDGGRFRIPLYRQALGDMHLFSKGVSG